MGLKKDFLDTKANSKIRILPCINAMYKGKRYYHYEVRDKRKRRRESILKIYE